MFETYKIKFYVQSRGIIIITTSRIIQQLKHFILAYHGIQVGQNFMPCFWNAKAHSYISQKTHVWFLYALWTLSIKILLKVNTMKLNELFECKMIAGKICTHKAIYI